MRERLVSGAVADSLQSAILGIGGVSLGVVLKAGIDLLTQKQENKREDDLRFVDQRRESYAALIATVMAPMRALELVDSRIRNGESHSTRARQPYMLTKAPEPIEPIDDLYAAVELAETQVRNGLEANLEPIVSLLGEIANDGRTQLGLPKVDFLV